MDVYINDTTEEIGRQAAEAGAAALQRTLEERGRAQIVVGTGSSQFAMYDRLVELDVDWGRVTVYHLDEYVGMSDDHPASFRRYLRERFEQRLRKPVKEFHYISGDHDPEAECRRLNRLISETPIDVCFIGIGENGHVAFNDPPADFETEDPYIVVELDEACRRQQLGEGWFDSLEDVPTRAISMSVKQIMSARTIICTVPDRRKAEAVRDAVEGPVTPEAPASILQEHPHCLLFLDQAAAAKLTSAG